MSHLTLAFLVLGQARSSKSIKERRCRDRLFSNVAQWGQFLDFSVVAKCPPVYLVKDFEERLHSVAAVAGVIFQYKLSQSALSAGEQFGVRGIRPKRF